MFRYVTSLAYRRISHCQGLSFHLPFLPSPCLPSSSPYLPLPFTPPFPPFVLDLPLNAAWRSGEALFPHSQAAKQIVVYCTMYSELTTLAQSEVKQCNAFHGIIKH